MMHPPERSPERDAALEAMLPHVPFDGWTYKTLRMGLRSMGAAEEDAELLFPGGAADMIEAFSDLADRRMEEGAGALDLAGMRTPQRVRALIVLRLKQNRPHREAIRRALSCTRAAQTRASGRGLQCPHCGRDLARRRGPLGRFQLVYETRPARSRV